eukprot:CAMPEP_0169455426 /NCGR_PEP_ID=MMETSP1042-20121227/15807_1 /TAXON_ID=464988 /ORGANISM="Hemiselmis andersenii, Strain CCMP1180" /LENGTH=334 /DNA_ID=CAMNT_0009567569 /DNA_START=124 /DNA_END=1124 /DNA_ORIENTATION=-
MSRSCTRLLNVPSNSDMSTTGTAETDSAESAPDLGVGLLLAREHPVYMPDGRLRHVNQLQDGALEFLQLAAQLLPAPLPDGVLGDEVNTDALRLVRLDFALGPVEALAEGAPTLPPGQAHVGAGEGPDPDLARVPDVGVHLEAHAGALLANPVLEEGVDGRVVLRHLVLVAGRVPTHQLLPRVHLLVKLVHRVEEHTELLVADVVLGDREAVLEGDGAIRGDGAEQRADDALLVLVSPGKVVEDLKEDHRVQVALHRDARLQLKKLVSDILSAPCLSFASALTPPSALSPHRDARLQLQKARLRHSQRSLPLLRERAHSTKCLVTPPRRPSAAA